MEEPENRSKIFSGQAIAKNTFYNLIGYGIPLFVAVLAIPLLIRGLGVEKFGILNLIWIVIGYFSFFDFGIGKSLTKIVSEKLSNQKENEIPGIFWTSLIIMLVISSIGALILLIYTPFLIKNYFKISENIHIETIKAFYVLSISIPLVATSAGLRGVLEAYHKFGIINVIRSILGILTFLGPLVCLAFSDNLLWIVIVLVMFRSIIWALFLYQCFKINPNLRSQPKFFIPLVKPILKFSSWITLANIVGPLLIYSDRFLIGSMIAASAITYYATPYEVVTKLLLIPGSLVLVLFPIFSSFNVSDQETSKKLFIRSVKYIFLILYPIILLIVTFSYEGIFLWLGKSFAEKSSLVLQLLSIGVLFNGLASIPFNFLQGLGKPKIPAIVNLLELPFYILGLWLMINYWGIIGVAVCWLLRISIDSVILFVISKKMMSIQISKMLGTYLLIFFNSILFFPLITSDVYLKAVYLFTILLLFSIISWRYLVNKDEKHFLFILINNKIFKI